MPRIAVIGGGAVGSAVAGALVNAGRDVFIVARGERLEALRAAPLRIMRNGMAESTHVPVVSADGPLPSVDIAINCVKTYDLPATLPAVRSALRNQGLLLTLQNGVEAHEIAASALQGTAIMAGRVHGFFELDGALVRHVGVSPSIVAGTVRGNGTESADAMLGAFSDCTIPLSLSLDIRRDLWEKFFIAAGLGTVAAALDIPAGQVLTHPEGGPQLEAVMGEIESLAAARGFQFNDADLLQITSFIRSFPAQATTSLQRDLSAGRRSEFDALTGAVLRLAGQSHVPVPTIAALADRILCSLVR